MRYRFRLVAATFVLSVSSAMAAKEPPMGTDTPTTPGAGSAQMSQMQLTRSSSRDHRLHGDHPKVRTAGPYERGLQHPRIGSSAIKLNPKMNSAYDERASAYEQTGVHDRAAADIAEAIKLDPNNPDLHKLR